MLLDWMKQRRELLLPVAVGACVVLGLAASRLVRQRDESDVRSAPAVLLPEIAAVADEHLATADERCRALVEAEVAAIDGFLAEAKQGAPGFAATMLGWGSKWRLVADFLPRTEKRHDAYVRQQFRRQVLDEADLQQALAQLSPHFAAELNSVENEMLVGLRADVAELGANVPLATADVEQVAAAYGQALASLGARAALHAPGAIGSDVLSLAAGEIIAAATIRLGVSAGILGTGAGSGWATCGVGLAAGVVVDQVVTRVWEWWADPTGDLVREVELRLDELGAELKGTLRVRLDEFVRERNGVRRDAVASLLQTSW